MSLNPSPHAQGSGLPGPRMHRGMFRLSHEFLNKSVRSDIEFRVTESAPHHQAKHEYMEPIGPDAHWNAY